MSGVEIREARSEDRAGIIELCRASLGWDNDPRFEQLFAWKHDRNVFGPSFLWVATDKERIVGLRCFMRWDFERAGKVFHAVRAVDTATHPDFQGRGVFTALTKHAIDEVQSRGIDFVFNTPNEKSRPGYKKMGWEIVGRIPLSIRPVRPVQSIKMIGSHKAASHWPLELGIGQHVDDLIDSLPSPLSWSASHEGFKTQRSLEFLSWRYGNSLFGCRVLRYGEGYMFFRLRKRGPGRELVVLGAVGLSDSQTAEAAAACAKESHASYILTTGHRALANGYLPVLGAGPVLAWHDLRNVGSRGVKDWCFEMGDLELF